MLGGNAPGPDFRWNKPMALAYCSPRKTNSASFSRRAIWFHAGIATVIITAMMLRPTSNAAIAYPWS
jgi:hypothetical protein